MVWGEKYKALLRDRFNVLGTVKIYQDGYSGVVTTLIGAGSTPLRFEFCNKSDDPFDPIKSSRVILTVWSFSMFALAELYSVEDMYHKVEIFNGENLYWTGYIDPHQCTEQYGPVPYSVSVCCIDGLTLLKNILYEESPGTPYNGRIRESQIILDILAKIGFTSFYEFCNIYENRMADSVDDSPFDQTFPDVDIFKDMYCYEVLEKILNSFNAIIRQSYGVFYITRPTEMIGDSVAGRYFTDATTKNSVIITPDQFIYRPDTHPSSTIRQVPGGVKMMQSPAKKVTIKQDYGWKESWLDNWEFKGDTYHVGPGTWDYWTNNGSTPLTNWITTETDGCALPSHAIPYTYKISQIFGINAIISATDKFGFSFDWMTYSWHDGSINAVTISIQVKNNTNSKYLTRSGANILAWVDTEDYVDFIYVVPNGISEWKTWKGILLTGLEANGSYTITLYGSHAAGDEIDFITGFKNIKFFVNSEEMSAMESMQVLPYQRDRFLGIFYSKMRQRTVYKTSKIRNTKGKDYTKTNPINGEEVEYDCLLGDVVDANIENVLEQFAGALAIIGDLQFKVDKVRLTGSSGIIAISCGGAGGSVVFNSTLTQTAIDFVTDNAADFAAVEITVTSDGEDVIFTSDVAGMDFDDAAVTYKSGTMDGIVTHTTPAYTLNPTISWSRRWTVEMKELSQIICDEIADQYSRPKQLIQMPIMDTSGQMAINLLGNIQDTINTLDGKARVFVINRGDFDERNRMWNLDLFEIGTETSSFIMTFDTEKTGSATKTIVIPTYSNGYNCKVDWGDGSSDDYVGGTLNTPGTITHIYATIGIKEVSISGTFPQIYFNDAGDKLKLIEIKNWGTGVWRSMEKSFYGCLNLIATYGDQPNTNDVTNMSYMFRDCFKFNGSVANFNTSLVTDMSYMFYNCWAFNQSVANFDTAEVTDMTYMFCDCHKFNQSVANFDTAKVTTMYGVFTSCWVFNQSVANFDTAKVTTMYQMFYGCWLFNQSVANFDTALVTSMYDMFCNCLAFNQNISGFNVVNVTSMFDMFLDAFKMTTSNYDALLIAWSAQDVKNDVPFHAGTAKYTAGGAAAAARAHLVLAVGSGGHGWTITDGGQV